MAERQLGPGASGVDELADKGYVDTAISTAVALKMALLVPTAQKTANYSASVGELVRCDATGGTFQVDLPSAPANGSLVGVKTDTAFTVTISRSGTDAFNIPGGSATQTSVMQNQIGIFQYNSGVWYQIAQAIPIGQMDNRYLTPTGVQTVSGKTLSTTTNTISDLPWSSEMVVNSGLVADGYNDMPGGISVEGGPNASGINLDSVWCRVGDLSATNTGGDLVISLYSGTATTQGTLITTVTITNGTNNQIGTLGSPFAVAANAVLRASLTKGSSTLAKALHVQFRGRYVG